VAQLIAMRSRGHFSLDTPNPCVLLVAAKWWPLSARMAIALSRYGCHVSAICPTGHPLTHVSGVRHLYPYGGISPLSNLRRALQECRPDIVVPCDDGAVAQLHALHEIEPPLQALIERSVGPAESFSVVKSRYRLLNAAIELGVRVPRTRRVQSADDLARWHAEVGSGAVLKVDGECGGHGVRMTHSLEKSLAAWRELRSACGAVTAWKRLAIDRDPLALWQRRGGRDVTVQEFIVGRPANAMLVCWRGKLLSIVCVVVVAADGPTGAATVVRVIQNEAMLRAAQLIVARFGLSGFYGLVFIIQSGTGLPFLIEMNPRCTQLGHLELPVQGSLAGVFSAILRGGPLPEVKDPVRRNTIAFFPQALAAGEGCRPHIDASYHDLPLEEPDLVQELMRKPWPQRRWAARIYHAFKPRDRAVPVFFESLDTDAEPHTAADFRGVSRLRTAPAGVEAAAVVR
jgi:hypothetical protein